MLLVCDVCMYWNEKIKNGLNFPFFEKGDLSEFLFVPLGWVLVLLPYVIRVFRPFSVLVLNLARGLCTVGYGFCIFVFSCTFAYAFCIFAHYFCIFGLMNCIIAIGDFNGL